jgi:predicted permease
MPGERRSSWSRSLGAIAADVRDAIRRLGRQPGSALVAIATVALGVTAATAVFSVAYGVLLRPLPWRDADRLVRLTETRPGGTNRLGAKMTSAPYVAWQDHAATIDGLGAWSMNRVTMAGDGESARVRIAEVTAGLFPLLGVQPLVGARFTTADELIEQQAPVILSYGLWHERYGGRPDVLGHAVTFDGKPYRITGVMPRSFAFPDQDTRAWIPFHVKFQPGGLSIFNAVARLKPGITARQAAAEATALGRSGPDPGVVVMAVFGSRAPLEIAAVPLLQFETATVRVAILVFFVAAGLLLATATANVASIQLARGAARRREVAIRASLGASAAALARQALADSAVLCLAGGAAGLALAGLLHQALPLVLPADFPRLADIRLDWRIAAFALAISLAASLGPGALVALQARRVRIVESLAEDGIAPAGATTRSRAARARALIIAGQMGIACTLLVGAVLLTRSFVALVDADRGYDSNNVLTASLPMPDDRFTDARRGALVTSLLERLRGVPGVNRAAITTALPLTPGDILSSFPVLSPRTGAMVQAQALNRFVSPDYFATLRIRLVEGRGFDAGDTPDSAPVVVVNTAFARKYLDDRPVGQKLWRDGALGPGPVVVGVIEDVHHRSVTDPPAPEIYRTYTQSKGGLAFDEVTVAIQTTVPPADLIPTLGALVRQQDASIALDAVATMDDLLRKSLAQPRLYSILLDGLAGLALIVAAVGLFGVLAYTVGQRSREIGIRTALGARPSDIVRLVVRQGLLMACAGLVAGLVVSAAFAKSLSTLLYGVGAYDPLSYVLVPAILITVAALACFVPARRAARLDPLRALRE